MGDPDLASAARAARAALDAGVIDRLQAEALAALGEPSDDVGLWAALRLTLQGALRQATAAAVKEAEAAATKLEEDEAGAEVEDLAATVARLADSLRRLSERVYDPLRPPVPDALYASPRWQAEVAAARRHLEEGAELLDDGEPADAVTFEVLAARDRLRAAL